MPSAQEKQKVIEPPETPAAEVQSPDLPPQAQALEAEKFALLDPQPDSLPHHDQSLFLQLFKIGAAGFWVAAISLVMWLLTGIAAPFHWTFAALAIPASMGTMVMAFLVRRHAE